MPPPPPATHRGDRAASRHARAADAQDAGRRAKPAAPARPMRMRLPYSVLDALIQHARVEKLVEVRGASGTGTAGYRYALTDSAATARCSSSTSAATWVPRPCRWPSTTPTSARPWRPGRSIDRERLATRVRAPVVADDMYDQLGPGGELRQVAVPVRRARQRQDGHRRGDRPRARRRHARAARDRRRRPDDHDVRSGQPRTAPRRPTRRTA